MKSTALAAGVSPRAFAAVLSLSGILVLAPSGHASILTFNNLANYGSASLNVEVQVDNNTAGLLSFVVSISPTVALPNTGDLLGVFLEFNPHPTLSTSTSFSGAEVSSVVLNAIGDGGNNLSGTIAGLVPGGTFDAVITLGSTGSSSGFLTTASFTLDDNGGAISLADLVAVGIRAQSVGLPPNGGSGSSKLYDLYGTLEDPPTGNPPHMPEPFSALVWLGLVGIVTAGRRSR